MSIQKSRSSRMLRPLSEFRAVYFTSREHANAARSCRMHVHQLRGDKSRGNEIRDTQLPRFLLAVFCERVSNYASPWKNLAVKTIYFCLHERDRANVKSRWIFTIRGRTKSHFKRESVFVKIDRKFFSSMWKIRQLYLESQRCESLYKFNLEYFLQHLFRWILILYSFLSKNILIFIYFLV